MTTPTAADLQARLDTLATERQEQLALLAAADNDRGPEARAALAQAEDRIAEIDREAADLRAALTAAIGRAAAPALAQAQVAYHEAVRALVKTAARVHAADALVSGDAPPPGILLTVPALRPQMGDDLARELSGVHLGNGTVQVAEDVTGPAAREVYASVRAALLGTA